MTDLNAEQRLREFLAAEKGRPLDQSVAALLSRLDATERALRRTMRDYLESEGKPTDDANLDVQIEAALVSTGTPLTEEGDDEPADWGEPASELRWCGEVTEHAAHEWLESGRRFQCAPSVSVPSPGTRTDEEQA